MILKRVRNGGTLLPFDLIAKINLSQRALLHYDFFAISRVLPTVPRIRFSCILCTWFPLRRSEDTPVEHPGSAVFAGRT